MNRRSFFQRATSAAAALFYARKVVADPIPFNPDAPSGKPWPYKSVPRWICTRHFGNKHLSTTVDVSEGGIKELFSLWTPVREEEIVKYQDVIGGKGLMSMEAAWGENRLLVERCYSLHG